MVVKCIKNNITLFNIVTSVVLQAVSIVYGFIISKLILEYFGSDVNGLVSSLNQFLSYVTLIEGGVTSVVLAALYKPLVDKDVEKISSILKTAKHFYFKLGIIFLLYSLIVAVIYPLIFNNSFSFVYVFVLTLILSLNLLIQYMFSLTYKTLLTADKKIYVSALSQIVMYILNIVFCYISVKVYPSIHVYKLITGLLFLIQPIVYIVFVNKNYRIHKKAKVDKNLLESRWDGFAINLAAFIHFSTDATILTIFTDLSVVSIYSVYSMITVGLKSIVNSVSSSIIPVVGQSYAKGNAEELNEKLDLYENIICFSVYFLYTIAALLITPFVMIYTQGITDANYYQPLFGVLLVISEALYIIKFPHLNFAYSINRFKEITKPAFVEAILNVLLSVILVNIFGLIGVVIGTIIAMIYRMIFHVYFTKKMIGRKQWIFYRKNILLIVATMIGLLICQTLIPKPTFDILSWIFHGIIYSVLFFMIYFFVYVIFFKKQKSLFVK